MLPAGRQIPLLLCLCLGLSACDDSDFSDDREVRKTCQQMEQYNSPAYTRRNMTQASCVCTLTYMRRTLEDNTWKKYLAYFNDRRLFEGVEEEFQVDIRAIDTFSREAAFVCNAKS